MNRIELLDKVEQFYKTPGNKPGIDSNGECQYYVDEQTKCAVGCLVQNPQVLVNFQTTHGIYSVSGIYNHANTVHDSTVIDELNAILPEDLDSMSDKLDFLSAIQSRHDRAANASIGEGTSFTDELETRLAKLRSSILPRT